jgi:hypothetical protein
MVTVFFNGTQQYVLTILLGGAAMDTICFAERIMGGLEACCDPEGMIPHEDVSIVQSCSNF